MECARNNPDYYDLNARMHSGRDGLKAEVKELTDGLMSQAASLQEECRRRRHQVKKVRYELGLRIQELEEQSDFTHRQILEETDKTLSEYEKRITVLEAELASEVSALEKLEARTMENEAAIEAERRVRSDQYSALSEESIKLEARIGDKIIAAVEREAVARADAVKAEAEERERLSAQLGEHAGAIELIRRTVSENEAVSSEEIRRVYSCIGDLSEAEIEALSGVSMFNDTARRKIALAREELHSEITEEKEARATRELELYAQIEDNRALIHEEQETRANETEAAAKSREELKARIEENTASIEREAQARATADEAEVKVREELAVKVGENTSAIETERTARITENEAEAKAREELSAKVGENAASIETVRTAISDSELVKTEELRRVQSYIGNLSEAELEAALTEADGEARRRLKLARAEEELTAQIEEGKKASAGYRLELLALMEGNEAEYSRKIEAVSDNLQAEVTARESLSAKVDSNTSAITAEQTARATADSAAISRISTLESTVGNNSAGLVQKVNTNASNIGSQAAAISTLQSTVGQHTASISTLNEVKDGVTARSYLHLDTNGYVSGIESYNGGVKNSSFKVIADKFQIVPPNTDNPTDIFEYDSNTKKLKVKNIEVDGADIKEGTIGGVKLSYDAVTADRIAADSIATQHLMAGAVTGAKILAKSIISDNIHAGAITADKISAGAITANKIAVGAVSKDKIEDGAVTAEKIHAGAITAEKLDVGSITADKISAKAITVEKINEGAVTSGKIAAGAVGGEKIADTAITEGKISAGAVSRNKIASGAVTSATTCSGTGNVSITVNGDYVRIGYMMVSAYKYSPVLVTAHIYCSLANDAGITASSPLIDILLTRGDTAEHSDRSSQYAEVRYKEARYLPPSPASGSGAMSFVFFELAQEYGDYYYSLYAKLIQNNASQYSAYFSKTDVNALVLFK